METHKQKTCDNPILDTLIGGGVDPDRAMELACTVSDVVGGPTTEQTIFVTGIIGLATAIFGLYVRTGRKWDEKGFMDYNPKPTNDGGGGRRPRRNLDD